jgi:hypothetical protein
MEADVVTARAIAATMIGSYDIGSILPNAYSLIDSLARNHTRTELIWSSTARVCSQG